MIRVTLFIALFALATAASLSLDSQWESFKVKYGKSYKSEAEESYRRSIFAERLEKIKAHNERAANGEVSYRKGINKFSDLTREEFRATYLGYQPSARRPAPLIHNVNHSVTVPDSVDWRTKGIVSEVKNQAACGSCWAFSAVAAMESAHAQKTGKLVELSEQNLIDCSWKYNNNGCKGGLMDNAFHYVKDNKGIDSEKSYPYISGDGKDYKTCKYSAAKKGASISSYVDIPSFDEKALLSAVAERVVSVAIDANSVLEYESGILDDSECSNLAKDLNHGVTIVGYGSENGTPYWIVKNSWGTTFGESGYFRLIRGKNACGVADNASYPVV
uniref:Cathepsin L1 n=1 Tax=Tetranychus evansi TaxID=178897 RepID=A0A3G5APC0_9ACAR|nr:cathepsin L1 [Tetranychus evansi]